MARLKDLADTTSDVFNMPLDRITIDPDFNVRHDSPDLRSHIEALRDSMLAQGYLRTRPLTIRMSSDQTSVTLIDGHCRFAAAKMAIAAGAEIVNIPCIAEGKGVSAADRALMLLTANNGLPLSPMEQAEVVKRLMSYGWSETEIGRKMGRTRQHVANLLELAGAPDAVRVMVVQGTVSATEAVKAIRRDGEQATAVLQQAEEIARAQGKTRVTPKMIPAGKHGKPHTNGTPLRTPVIPPDSIPRVLQVAKVPLSVAAQHVVDMAAGVDLPDDLDRAIRALADSLS
jgi:ParB family transcriptional regulator, chromosome partitioning protein